MNDVKTIWDNDWDSLGREPWEGGAHSRRVASGRHLGARVYELPPGATGGLYHCHHGSEEMLIVLGGVITLRTPDGERNLVEGEVVMFPPGAESTHQTINRGKTPTRHLMIGTVVSPDVVEYPDDGQIGVMALTPSLDGNALFQHYATADRKA